MRALTLICLVGLTSCAHSPRTYPFDINQEFAVPCDITFGVHGDVRTVHLIHHPLKNDGSPDLFHAQGDFGAVIKLEVTQRSKRYSGTQALTLVAAPSQSDLLVMGPWIDPSAVIGLALDSCQAYGPLPTARVDRVD